MARTIAKDHDEKRQAILKTAARFFADTGYDRSAMSQLAIACGISQASIFSADILVNDPKPFVENPNVLRSMTMSLFGVLN